MVKYLCYLNAMRCRSLLALSGDALHVLHYVNHAPVMLGPLCSSYTQAAAAAAAAIAVDIFILDMS